MARRVSRLTNEQVLMRDWRIRGILCLASLAIAYGFISLAIDTGSLFEYAAAIFFVWYAAHNGIRSVRLAL